jgi:hypothetical protein
MERPLLSGDGFVVRLGVKEFLHAAQCIVYDQKTVDKIIDEKIGDPLAVRGVVDRTIMGVVILEDCQIRPTYRRKEKSSRSPSERGSRLRDGVSRWRN